MISPSRLFGIATSYPEFIFEREAEEIRPVSPAVEMPDFLAGSFNKTAGIVEKANLAARFDSPPVNMSEYEASGGLEALKQAHAEAKPQHIFSEIVLGGVTRKPEAWQRVQLSPDIPVIVANAHAGDPSAAQARLLIDRDPYSVIEGMFIAAVITGADKGYLYLDPQLAAGVQRLTGIALEMRQSSGIDFSLEVISGPLSLVCSEDSAAIGSLERDRPMPFPTDPAIRGINARPTLVDSVECFAAITASLAVGSPVTTRLYQVSGVAANNGIFEAEPDLTISDILAKSGANADAAVLVGGLSGRFAARDAMSLPLKNFERTDSPRYRALHVFAAGSDLLKASTEMAVYNGRHLCGYCIPCRIGAVRLAELLTASTEDPADLPVALLKELAQAVEKSSLCHTGKGAAGMIFSALETLENETGNN